jgi:hypothetical protein
MSDRDLIIGLLQKVERRTRANRLYKNAATEISIALLIPVIFKLIDLFYPFRGRTVAFVLGIWGVAAVVFFAWRLRGREALADVAGRLDRKAELQDQMKTAYWFIRNPADSPWVDAQLHHAARQSKHIDIDSLYPRFIPKMSYIAASLVLVLIVLNFVPLAWNHNWLYLQAAPAFAFTDAEQALLKQAELLLKKAETLEKSQLAEKVEDIVNQLQEGTISIADAIRQLGDIQQELDEGNLDVASINQGLEDMARELAQSKQMESLAESMARHDLKEAADEARRVGDQLKPGSAEAKQMREKLQQAAENSRQGLEDLSKDLKDAADALGEGDNDNFQAALDKASQDLQKLSDKMDSQQLKNQASQKLQDVQSSLQQRQQNSNGAKSGQQEARQRSNQQQGQAQAKGGSTPNESKSGAPSEEGDPGGPGGESEPGDPTNAGGQMPSGGGGGPVPLYGEATKLDVQLEQEQLTGQAEGGLPKPEKDEEASRQERSKLDYRNVPSDLTPAQKDLLNQDRLPWEYRPLIKQYFEAIRTPAPSK